MKLGPNDFMAFPTVYGSGGWQENKMVLVKQNRFQQSEPARGRVVQGRGHWEIFACKANMAKLSFNDGSEIFIQYLGLFEVM